MAGQSGASAYQPGTVNRFWQMLFGTGLVKTGNDYGSQGEWPSHPELLDWLACEFRDGAVANHDHALVSVKSDGDGSRITHHDWDIKAILRLLVTSSPYRQSAALSPQLLERDPYNRLLARGPRFRMDAEMIRDSA